MTLAEALASLAERCTVSTVLATTGAVLIASGGQTHDADVPPLLCSTREMAVATWLDAMRDVAPDGSTLAWAEEPGMYRYQVSVSNADVMTQRLVGDRFAVVASVVVTSPEGMELP